MSARDDLAGLLYRGDYGSGLRDATRAIRRTEYFLTDLGNADLRPMFQVDRQMLKDRLNLRWKMHRDPGGWGEQLPQSILIRYEDGGVRTQMHTIGRMVSDGSPTGLTVTPVPAAFEGEPGYYLPQLGRWHA